jgi:Nickel responsive protein SCO4226-like
MTRYLIERVWDPMEEEEISAKGPLSKRILVENERFSPVVWEHSHTVMDEQGRLKSYCVYSSPSTDLIHEHAELLGGHRIEHIYEIGGDISPDDFD